MQKGQPKLSVLHSVTSIENEAAGPSYTVPALVEAQREHGIDSLLISLSNNHDERDDGWHTTYPQYGSSIPALNRLGFSPMLKNAVSDMDTQLVHVHGLWQLPGVYCAKAAYRKHIPIVLTPRGMLSSVSLSYSSNSKKLFSFLFQQKIFKNTAMFHATAEAEMEEIRSYGLNAPVAIIPNGVDIPFMREKVDKQGSRTVLSLGRIHPKKGLERLLYAWKSLELRHTKWRLKIVGPDENNYVNELKILIKQYDIERVEICSPVFGVNKINEYAAADIFVLATLNENFAMTVAESLAVSVPVICTKGAPWQGLEDNGCGWWIDLGSKDLANALDTAMATPEQELDLMGARGRLWMEQEYSWKRISQMTIDSYRWLLGESEKPSFIVTD